MAGRPTKSVKVISKYSQTKDELKERGKNEEKLKGGAVPPAPKWLTQSQKEIYDNIVECLKESEMLCLNDVWILEKAAVAIDRVEAAERRLNEIWGQGYDEETELYLKIEKQYTQDFFRACNELCLSPQSRAKLANAVTAKAESEPLKDLLGDIGNL